MRASGTKCAWVIYESKDVQTHVQNTITDASMCLGCLVALKRRVQLFKTNDGVS